MRAPTLRIEQLAQAVLESGASPDAHFKLARACLDHDRLVFARDLALRLLTLDPHHGAACELLREVYTRDPVRASAGAQVQCSCCGGHLPTFVPGGDGLRPNARCPLCGSLERHRFLALWLSQNLGGTRRILHVAAELCLHAITHRTGAEVVKGDLEPRDDLIRLDVTDIQFSEGHFDGILCNHVLEHVPDDRRAMSELYRVLAPAGWAVLAVPIDTNRAHTYEDPSITEPEDRAVHFGQSDHVRWYGRDYAGRLREAGFTVEEFRVQEAVGADAVGAYGLDPGEWVHLCRK